MKAKLGLQSVLEGLLKGLFYLTLFGLFMPTGYQYSVAGLMLIVAFLIYAVYIRKSATLPPLTRFQSIVVKVSLLLMITIFLQGALTGWIQPYPGVPYAKHLKDAYHLAAKTGLYPLAFLFCFRVMKHQNISVSVGSNTLVTFLIMYFAYMLGQRYQGWNWVKGFEAVLPDHRHAYGVYRANGFMGHPLSLAYNCALAFAMVATLAGVLRGSILPKAWHWVGLMGLVLMMLFLTGSRWPVGVVMLMLVPIFVQIWRRAATTNVRVGCVGFLIAAVSILALDVNFRGRLSEIGELNVETLEKRIPRLVFWKIHLEMFQDQPLLGVGLGARTAASLDYYDRAGYNNMERKYSAHNMFLQVLADSGLVGAAVLLIAFFLLIRGAFFIPDANLRFGVLAIALATILLGFMQNHLRDTEFVFAFWFSLLVVSAAESSTRSS